MVLPVRCTAVLPALLLSPTHPSLVLGPGVGRCPGVLSKPGARLSLAACLCQGPCCPLRGFIHSRAARGAAAPSPPPAGRVGRLGARSGRSGGTFIRRGERTWLYFTFLILRASAGGCFLPGSPAISEGGWLACGGGGGMTFPALGRGRVMAVPLQARSAGAASVRSAGREGERLQREAGGRPEGDVSLLPSARGARHGAEPECVCTGWFPCPGPSVGFRAAPGDAVSLLGSSRQLARCVGLLSPLKRSWQAPCSSGTLQSGGQIAAAVLCGSCRDEGCRGAELRAAAAAPSPCWSHSVS